MICTPKVKATVLPTRKKPHPRGTFSPEILDHAPSCIGELAGWFESLDNREFDTCCVSAIISYVCDDIADEGSFVSVKPLAAALNAMRSRYRFVADIPEHTAPRQRDRRKEYARAKLIRRNNNEVIHSKNARPKART